MEHDDEALYQGVEVEPGVFKVKMRPYPPPRILTGSANGVEPPFSSQPYYRHPFLNGENQD